MAGKLDLRPVLPLPYDRPGFIRDVLRPVFGLRQLTVYSADQSTGEMTATDKRLALSAVQYGELTLDDGTEVRCLEVRLQPKVRPEQSRVGIQALVRRLLTVGQAALVNFVPAATEVGVRPWRFTLVAKDAVLRDGKVVEQTNNARRYTYLLGPGQACRTPADRLRQLATEAEVTLDTLVKTFEVEVLSKEFFKEYKRHYGLFCEELMGSNFRKSVFNGDEKAIRDFVKKLLGRLVFLYFVQKKGWLGASSPVYADGDQGFITTLFHASGANATFYPVWLSRLFFETLNEERTGDLFTMPDGQKVCIPFLNGGLFDRDAHDAAKYQLTLPPTLFHQPGHADDPAGRGFLDFLDSYNFTVQEDSPDEHVVAVDPEMLGNIFENLLEDNKDKGAFYTPKEIVHYMCRESLIEYLDTRLNVFDVALGSTAKGLAAGTSPTAKAGQLALTTTENRGNVQRVELEKFVREKVANDFIRQHARQIDELLDTVKICDPAIGSGAFPMGLLHEIYLCKLVLKDLTQVQDASLFHARDLLADPGSYHTGVKLGIIQNSIYGVDIERGAVDIARLRFWLSLVVDEDRPRPLPNLDYKIVVGNSLVSKLGNDTLALNWSLKAGTEREAKLRQQYKSLGTLQRQFFTKSGAKKLALQTQIRDAKIDLLIAQVELEMAKLPTAQATMFGGTAKQQAADLATLTIRQRYDAQLRQLRALRADTSRALPYFDWRLDFPEVLNPHVTDQPGFDIMIGNPPYVKEYTNREVFEDIPYFQGKMDMWYSFACSGVDFLRENGLLTFIATNNWTTNAGASIMRNKIITDSQIRRLIDFGNYMIFENAAIQTMIMQFQKSRTESTYSFDLRRLVGKKSKLTDVVDLLNEQHTTQTSFLSATVDRTALKDKYLLFGEADNELVLAKIRKAKNFELDERSEIAQGIVPNPDVLTKRSFKLLESNSSSVEVGDGVFVVDKGHFNTLLPDEDSYLKPLYEPSDLSKYSLPKQFEKQLIYLTKRNAPKSISSIRNIINHLSQFKEVMEERRENQLGRLEYFHLHWPREEKFFTKGPKILSVRKCALPTFTYTEEEAYVMMSFNVIKTARADAKYLTGLLNSKLVAFWLRSLGKMQGEQYQIDKEPLLEIPLHVPKDTKPVANLVTKILATKAASATADTTALEAEIDVLVYHLYGLKYDEVLLVEPGFGMSEAAYVAAGAKLA